MYLALLSIYFLIFKATFLVFHVLIKSPLKELLDEYKILKKNKILRSKFF